MVFNTFPLLKAQSSCWKDNHHVYGNNWDWEKVIVGKKVIAHWADESLYNQLCRYQREPSAAILTRSRTCTPNAVWYSWNRNPAFKHKLQPWLQQPLLLLLLLQWTFLPVECYEAQVYDHPLNEGDERASHALQHCESKPFGVTGSRETFASLMTYFSFSWMRYQEIMAYFPPHHFGRWWCCPMRPARTLL